MTKKAIFARLLRRKNNRPQASRNSGSALIVVIICMLFVGIIASVVLSLASSNLSNMTLFRRSTENFYTAENAIDELKANIQEYADVSVRYAYKNWLQQYSYLSHSEQTALFQSLFLDDFYEKLRNAMFAAGTMTQVDVTNGVQTTGTPLGLPSFLSTDYTSANIEWEESPVITKTDDAVVMSISLKYTEEDGTVSVISTDLVFSLENPDFQINTVSGLNTATADYSIVADKYISNNPAGDVNAMGGSVEIHGDIYGGGDADGYGFDFANAAGSSIALRSDRILTRTTMRVSNGANLSVQGNSDYSTTGTEIWARNILLTNTGTNKTSPSMWVTGDVYLADDLTLTAPGSYFNFRGRSSKFFGYGASEDDVANSSAIIINGAGSILLMTEPDPLYGGKISISGKSFISVPSKFGAGASIQGTLLQGESIAYKGEQAAYLLPGECVIGIGHNPMTEAEFEKLSNGSDNVYYTEASATTAGKTSFVNIDKSAVNGGIDLAEYVQAARAVKVMRVKYDNATTMVYLYLNFRDSASATAFFKQYSEFNPDLVADRVQSIVDSNGYGGIKINALALETTGNTVHTNDDASSTGNVLAATKPNGDSSMVVDQWSYTTSYNGLVNNLSKDYIGLGTQTYLTDNLVNMSMIPAIDKTISAHGTGGEQIKVMQADGTPKTTFNRGTQNSSYYLYVGRNITVTTRTAGIIIASGDVTISSGQFTGLIIARGKVVFSGTGNKCYSDPENILYIMQNCDEANSLATGSADVTQYFQVTNVTTGSGSGGEVLASDLISIKYENWKKK